MAIGAVHSNPLSADSRTLPSKEESDRLPQKHFAAQLSEAHQSERASETRAPSPQGGTVRAQRTPLSGEQAAKAIAGALERQTGKPPSRATLAILTSHWSLETGQGAKMYNYNFAGIKGRGPEGMTAVLKTREGWGAGERHIRDGFRAYSSVEAGAEDYVSLLLRRYSSAVEAAEAEDPVAFAHELKQGGYFTGNAQAYASGVAGLANRAMESGLNALGANGGALASTPRPARQYFDAPPAVGGYSPHLTSPGPLGPTTEAMADAITRAALSIAAQYGADRS